MDFLQHSQLHPNQIIGVHPETHRLRDFTGLYRYLAQHGLDVHRLDGVDRLYILGDHGGENMLAVLHAAHILGRIPLNFDPQRIKQDICSYVNHLADEMLSKRSTTSHEVAPLVTRMIRSYFLNDGAEYVLGIYADHLGKGRVVYSGEPAQFMRKRAQPKPLESFLTSSEKAEYFACLERMYAAQCARNLTSPAQVTLPFPSFTLSFAEQIAWLQAYRKSLLEPPLFLPA